MQFVEDPKDSRYNLSHHDKEGFTVNGKIYPQSLIIGRETLISDWRPQTLDALKPRDFDVVIELAPSIVLIGTGQNREILDMAVIAPLFQAGIGVEIMSTPAACRTLVVLQSEGRDVLAALLR